MCQFQIFGLAIVLWFKFWIRQRKNPFGSWMGKSLILAAALAFRVEKYPILIYKWKTNLERHSVILQKQNKYRCHHYTSFSRKYLNYTAIILHQVNATIIQPMYQSYFIVSSPSAWMFQYGDGSWGKAVLITGEYHVSAFFNVKYSAKVCMFISVISIQQSIFSEMCHNSSWNCW